MIIHIAYVSASPAAVVVICPTRQHDSDGSRLFDGRHRSGAVRGARCHTNQINVCRHATPTPSARTQKITTYAPLTTDRRFGTPLKHHRICTQYHIYTRTWVSAGTRDKLLCAPCVCVCVCVCRAITHTLYNVEHVVNTHTPEQQQQRRRELRAHTLLK